MEDSARIRLATEADVPLLVPLYAAHLDEQSGWDPLLAQTRNPDFDHARFLRQLLASGSEELLVSELGSEILGFIRFGVIGEQTDRRPGWNRHRFLGTGASIARKVVARLSTRTRVARREPTGTISDAYVIPARRREKVGTELVDAAITWFRERGIRVVALQVLDQNVGGRRFWSELGFEPYRHTMLRSL